MRFDLRRILLLVILGLIFVTPIYAASSTYLPKAQKYYSQQCSKKIISNDTSLLCYVFDKVNELSAVVTTLNSRVGSVESDTAVLSEKVASQEAKIKDLQDRLALFDKNTPKQVVFATNRPQPFNSEWIDTTGYSLLKINLSISGGISQYDVHYSDDKITYTVQTTVNCYGSSVCAESNFGIHGRYYRISTGTASGNITSTGLLYN